MLIIQTSRHWKRNWNAYAACSCTAAIFDALAFNVHQNESGILHHVPYVGHKSQFQNSQISL